MAIAFRARAVAMTLLLRKNTWVKPSFLTDKTGRIFKKKELGRNFKDMFLSQI